MKRKNYTEEQIIGMLKEHEAGMTIEDLSRKHGVAKSSLQRWKSKYVGMEVSEAKRIHELKGENAKLEAEGVAVGPRNSGDVSPGSFSDVSRKTPGYLEFLVPHRKTENVQCFQWVIGSAC